MKRQYYMTHSVFLDTLQKKKTSRPPIWMMRQAGRVLPSYNKLKERYTFKELMDDPELASDVTLLPVDELNVDAAILFSDILVIPEALGMKLEFPNQKPRFESSLKQYEQPSKVLKDNSERLNKVFQTINLIKSKSDIPLIGFCGGPLTVLCYMYQGIGSDTSFPDLVKFIYSNRVELDRVLSQITEMSAYYALQQVKHGIDAFQLFETHAGLIPYSVYFDVFYPHVRKILSAVRSAGVKTIFFPRGIGYGLKEIQPEDTDFVSVDWQLTLKDARQLIHSEIGLQGNFDQRLLLADKKTIITEVEKMLEFSDLHDDWIFNLGHGLIPQINISSVECLVETVLNFKKQ